MHIAFAKFFRHFLHRLQLSGGELAADALQAHGKTAGLLLLHKAVGFQLLVIICHSIALLNLFLLSV
jgi:hypothetical protein